MNKPNEEETFPLQLLLRNDHGRYILSRKIVDGYTVDGVVTLDTIVLRETIKPEAEGAQNLHDLRTLAEKVDPKARPLFDEYACSKALLNLLVVCAEEYKKTAQMLENHGIKMPSIDGKVYYTNGLFDDTDRVDFVWPGFSLGNSMIHCVEEMILVVQMAEVVPQDY